MLTLQEFEALRPDQELELGPLFRGLSEEPIKLTVTNVEPHKVRFHARYFGISLGIWSCRRVGGHLYWGTKP